MKINKRISTFIFFAYGISWTIWGRQLIDHQFQMGWSISRWNHILGGLGPFLAALITLLIFDGRKGIRQYFSEKLLRFPPLKWLLIGFLMPALFFGVAWVIIGLATGDWVTWSEIGLNSKVPWQRTWQIWLLWCLFYGLGEEGGWRGFLFPEFVKNYKPRISTLYVAFIWAPWHLPIFFYDKDFQNMGLFGIFGWVVGLIFGSLLLGWLVKQSSWNLWPVILWHGTFNLFTTSDLIHPMFPALMSAMVIVFVLWIARRYGEDLVWPSNK